LKKTAIRQDDERLLGDGLALEGNHHDAVVERDRGQGKD
jgi:hypothetical protein